MTAQQTATEDTRSYILQQAEAYFGTRGYRGFSMRELAEACGLAKGTLYHHFSSKQDLYLHVLNREALMLQDMLAEAAGSPGPVTERIKEVAFVHYRYLIEKQYLFHTGIRDGGSFEDIRKIFAVHQEGITAPLISVLEDGISAGIIRDLNSTLMAQALIGMITGLVRYYIVEEAVEITEQDVTDVLSVFLEGAIN